MCDHVVVANPSTKPANVRKQSTFHVAQNAQYHGSNSADHSSGRKANLGLTRFEH